MGFDGCSADGRSQRERTECTKDGEGEAGGVEWSPVGSWKGLERDLFVDSGKWAKEKAKRGKDIEFEVGVEAG